MRRVLRGAALFGLLGLFVNAGLADEAKKADPPKDQPAKKDEPKKEDPYKVVSTVQVAKIVRLSESTHGLKLSVPTQVPNQGAAQALADAQRRLQDAIRRNDRNAAINAQRDIAKHQAELVKTEWKEQPEEIDAIEEVKVRVANPPPKFDEKGNIAQYTPKELDELKGPDKKAPGYPGDWSDLKPGQYVQITLVLKKNLPDVAKLKAEGKEITPEIKAEFKPKASLIVVLQEPQPGK
jgi:hypothetical protein